jgi:hypothetical protein
MIKHKKIHEMVDKFLKERRMSMPGGSWAEVTDQDIEDLYNLIDIIIDAKCQKDCDGDQTIQVRLVNRRKEYMPSFVPVPYCKNKEDERRKRYEVGAYNLAVAYGDFYTEHRIMVDHWHDEDRAKKEQKCMS